MSKLKKSSVSMQLVTPKDNYDCPLCGSKNHSLLYDKGRHEKKSLQLYL